jgi:hypothetical protein
MLPNFEEKLSILTKILEHLQTGTWLPVADYRKPYTVEVPISDELLKEFGLTRVTQPFFFIEEQACHALSLRAPFCMVAVDDPKAVPTLGDNQVRLILKCAKEKFGLTHLFQVLWERGEVYGYVPPDLALIIRGHRDWNKL